MSSSESSDAESTSSSSTSFGKRKVAVRDAPHEDSSSSDASHSSDSESSRPSTPDIPVVSHAEKRRLKKKEKLAEQAASTSKPSKNKKVAAGAESASLSAKRQNSVWVGNLSFKTTQEDIKTFFAGVGGEITRINMPTKKPNGPGMRGENRGFAYVDFSTPEAKAAAIGLSEQPLTGRRLLIKDGDDFAGRPAAPGAENATGTPSASDTPSSSKGLSKSAQRILRAQKQPPAPTLFFGNLGFETTDTSLREFLEAHRSRAKDNAKGDISTKGSAVGGDTDALEHDGSEEQKTRAVNGQASSKDPWIRKVRMGTFEDSGLCKGFGFVDFTSIENATAALINPKNHHMDGRDLVVEYASAEAVRRGGGSHGKGLGHRSPSKGTQHGKRDRPKPFSDDSRTFDGGKRHQREDDSEAAFPEGPSKRQRAEVETEDRATIPGKPGKRDRIRPKPGAALALAKRESAAILPSQGKKIVF